MLPDLKLSVEELHESLKENDASSKLQANVRLSDFKKKL